MNEDIQDHIDNYLLGRMSQDEMKSLEQKIASDDNVREMFLTTRMIQHELLDRNEKLRLMQQWKESAVGEKQPNPHRRLWWYGIGGFSAAAMAVWGVFLFRQSQSIGDVPLFSQDVQEKLFSLQEERDTLLVQEKAITQELTFFAASQTSHPNTATFSISDDDSARKQYEKYMHEAEYYQKQAGNYRREAEYYKKQAENYEREQEYHLKQAEKYQREAANCSKRGDMDRAKTQTRYAKNEMDKAKTEASYAKNAWDKYKTQMNYAKNADEKAATNLRYAREVLR